MTNFDWSQHTTYPWLQDRTIYLTRAGSHAYGTNIETSDVDYRGVAIAPDDCYLGVVSKFEQYESMGDRSGGNLHKTREQTGKEPDLVIYEFRKFVKLAAQANPNILELLFVNPTDHVLPEYCMRGGRLFQLGEELLSMGGLFVTKRARQTFAGYAHAQLKKIKHNTEHSIPGSSRFDRIEKFGYCTKNAMHLVRLLRMCREILETGQVNVKRKDAAELLAIRNGAWTLKELCEYAEQEDKDLDEVCRKSYLPEEPDMKEIDRRCVEIMKSGLEWLK